MVFDKKDAGSPKGFFEALSELYEVSLNNGLGGRPSDSSIGRTPSISNIILNPRYVGSSNPPSGVFLNPLRKFVLFLSDAPNAILLNSIFKVNWISFW